VRWIDLIRATAIIVVGYVVYAIGSLVVGHVIPVNGMFETAMLIVILWAVRDGQEPRA